MQIQLTNRQIYNIPKDVRRANIQIATSHIELETCRVFVGIEKFKIAREKNKEVLREFGYIGYEEVDKKDMGMEIEIHWFIHHLDLNKCAVSLVNDDE